MNIYALQTARGGSKSVPKKNVAHVKGIPLFLHNVIHSKNVKSIKDVYISTDMEFIKEHSEVYGYKIIDRPEDLKGDHASHYDTILHGLENIETQINDKVDILVVLLGNSIGAFSKDLENAIDMLVQNKEADSVQSVSQYNMYNPFRAYTEKDGYLNTILPQEFIKEYSKLKNINDRNAAGETFYFNGSFWVIKREALIKNDGLLPFPWLGKNILPYVQDNYMEVDAPWQLAYLQGKEWPGFNNNKE